MTYFHKKNVKLILIRINMKFIDEIAGTFYGLFNFEYLK